MFIPAYISLRLFNVVRSTAIKLCFRIVKEFNLLSNTFAKQSCFEPILDVFPRFDISPDDTHSKHNSKTLLRLFFSYSVNLMLVVSTRQSRRALEQEKGKENTLFYRICLCFCLLLYLQCIKVILISALVHC